MKRCERRQLQRLVNRETRSATQRLLADDDAAAELARLEQAQKILAASPSVLHNGWLVTLAVAAATAFVIGVLWNWKVRNTSVHVEALVEAVNLELGAAYVWNVEGGTRFRLESMTGLTVASYLQSKFEDRGCGIEVHNATESDLRLTRLNLAEKTYVTAWSSDDRELDLRLESSEISSIFSGEVPKAQAEVARSDEAQPAVLAVGEDFLHLATTCGSAELTLISEGYRRNQLELEAVDAQRLTFVRRAGAGGGSSRYRSALLAAKVTFLELHGEPTDLGLGEVLSVERPTGRITVEPEGTGLRVSFEGLAREVLRGRRQRPLNPSWLAYLEKNPRFLLLTSAVAAVWAFLWGARGFLLRE